MKTGVAPGSFFHRNECFGPVLGVMVAQDLDDAIAMQNATEFGLTGGLHSLDPDEIAHWSACVEVGNVYINRHTTGAIVRRQPFGGWKHSSVGPGAKTGGPDDILRFVRFTRPAPRTDDAVARARASNAHWWRTLYGTAHDDTGLAAERNELRHCPLPGVIVRTTETTGDDEIAILRDAATTAAVPFELVAPEVSDAELARRVSASDASRLRALGPVGDDVMTACHRANVVVDDTPVTGHGRVELGRWVREQAISRTLHRHGRVPGSDASALRS